MGKSGIGVLHGSGGECFGAWREIGDYGAARGVYRRGSCGGVVYVGAIEDAGIVCAGVWAICGANSDSAGAGNLAGILVTGGGHWFGGLAGGRGSGGEGECG